VSWNIGEMENFISSMNRVMASSCRLYQRIACAAAAAAAENAAENQGARDQNGTYSDTTKTKSCFISFK
jgi:hypothetical protein